MMSDEYRGIEHIALDYNEPERMQCFWLKQLAVQFAIFNERNARLDEYNRQMDERDSEKADERNRPLAEMVATAKTTLDRLGAPSCVPAGFPEKKQ